MANEITKVTDQNGVDHPFKDVAAFPRSEQAVLGAKNLADFVDGKSINPSGIVENYADRIATVNPIPINSGVGYKVTWTSEDTDVRCIYAVWNGSTLVRRELGITKDTVLNTSGGDKLYVCLYSGTQAVAVNTHKPMVILSTDTDSTYKPFAMTNEQLTKNLLPVKKTLTNIMENVTFSRNQIYIKDNILYLNAVFSRPTAIPAYTNIFTIPLTSDEAKLITNAGANSFVGVLIGGQPNNIKYFLNANSITIQVSSEISSNINVALALSFVIAS